MLPFARHALTAVAVNAQARSRLKVGAGICFAVVLPAVCILAARRLTSTSWPLADTNVGLVLAAASAYLASFVFRALGWQRLFRGERPDRSRCLAACGAAAASGVVLPFRLDYVVKISTLRRLGGVRIALDTVALSIVSLGLVDAVAMLPLAITAISTSGVIFIAPLVVVLLFCLGCIGVLVLGPRLAQLPLVSRSERVESLFTRVGENVGFSRATLVAGGFLFGCWTTRALGSTLLLSALGVGFTPTIALVVLCLSAAASILPITAGGAFVSVGATSAVLLALGVSRTAAVNYSLASGLLLTTAALVAAVVGVGGSLYFSLQRRRYAGAPVKA